MPRYHIHTKPAPPPFEYPAPVSDGRDRRVCEIRSPRLSGTAQRGDRYWTAEIITQTWFQAETRAHPDQRGGLRRAVQR